MGRKSKSDVRKPEILDHYYRVLSREGYAKATLDKVAAEVGIHSSLLVHYFKSKVKMTVELVELMTRRYEDYFYQKIPGGLSPEERLEAILSILFSNEWTEIIDGNVFYSCLELSLRHDEIKEQFDAMYGRMKERMVEEFSRLEKEGVIREAQFEKTAALIISLLEGMHIYYIFINKNPNFEELALYAQSIVLEKLKKAEK